MTVDIFCRILAQECAVPPGAHLLAAVSGGADSVAMLCLLVGAADRLGYAVSVAHVEHGIRGEQSLGDQAFVRGLCEKMNLPFYTTSVNAPDEARRLSCGLEDAARRLRYDFLERTRAQIGADLIVTAHHAGDQAETVLLHAARGSDVRGLCAMRTRRGNLIRPLLCASPQALREYLRSIGQTWREDETNADARYARNQVRRHVLPSLEAACPGAGSALCRLAAGAQRDEDFFSRQIDALDIRIVPLAAGAAVEAGKICGLHEALLSRVLVRLMEAAGAQASSYVINLLLRALRRGEKSAAVSVGSFSGEAVQARFGERYLCVTRPYMELPDTPLCAQGETHTPFGVFSVRDALPGETGDGMTCQAVPKRLLAGARVTSRRAGDSMVPFGQHSPSKVKKLMIDAGVERALRTSVPIVRSAQGIFWIPGLRPGEGCRSAQGERMKMIVFGGDMPWSANR